MIRLLKGYRERIYAEWIARVDRDCQFNLEQPLIQRDPETRLISVNFSKEVGKESRSMLVSFQFNGQFDFKFLAFSKMADYRYIGLQFP